jgi:hydroxypyruvate reductase
MIRNRGSLPATVAHDTALDCLTAGIRAARPARVVGESVRFDGEELEIGEERPDLATYDSVVVLGGGNAAGHVATALEDILGDAIDGGVVATDDPVATERVEVLPADHPLPSQRGVDSTRELLDVARGVGPNTLVLGVVTGGGSACMVAPASGITLPDLQTTTDALLDSGAAIHEINAVRKHLSAIKGGQFARALAPARVTALVLSDVVGDELDVVASGPLVPDSTTYADALDVLQSTGIEVPDAVRDRLEAGVRGDIAETPGPDDPAFDRVTTTVVGNNTTAIEAARDVATERGYDTLVLSSRIRGPSREAARCHVAVAEEMVATGNPIAPPAVVLSGGETTVRVTGEGRGGPNQEFALSAARDLPAEAVVGAVDTDGVDGNTDAAGALVDGETVADRAAAAAALEDNDSNRYLADRGALIETGPTGTNVNDLRVLVVGQPE